MESKIYKNKPQLIPEQKDEIVCFISDLELQLCENVFENVNKVWTSVELFFVMNANECILFIITEQNAQFETPFSTYDACYLLK